MENIILKLDSVSKSFDNGFTNTPNNISFEISNNDNLTLLKGKNGSGKTVLLKLITKEIKDYSGDIFYSKEFFKDLTIQYQDTGLIPNLTVEKNLSFVSNSNDDIISLFNVFNFSTDLLSKKAIELSGGESKQIQILRCILSKRKIWICDEPTASMDKNTIISYIDYIVDHIDNRIFIITSHDDFFISEIRKRLKQKIKEIEL